MSEQSQKVIRRDAPASHLPSTEPPGLTVEEEEILMAIGGAQGMPRKKLIKYLTYLDTLLEHPAGPGRPSGPLGT